MTQDLAIIDSRDVEGVPVKDKEDFVTFFVGNQMFGIPILKVRDILKLKEISQIPLAPSKVIGSVNLRGRIVTVISVRQCLGIGEQADGQKGGGVPNMGVTIEQDGELYTLHVDSIGDVTSVSADLNDGMHSCMDKTWREFVVGVYRLEGRLLVALDVDRLLNIQEY